MFLNLWEILDMLLMIGVVGFIFMSAFRAPKKDGDVLDRYLKKTSGFDWNAFWFATMVTAPAIILHEFGHKITALSFGLESTFHAAYLWLLIAVVLKLINFPFIFFVPAYVSIIGTASVQQSTLIAFMGPGINILLFIIAFIILKADKKIKPKTFQFWTLTKQINLFLLIFNLLPIPGFDGFTVFSGLWHMVGL
ncbi:MAG: hypothetical protein WC916_07335 [Candidatus Woesearchaeota archaeon]